LISRILIIDDDKIFSEMLSEMVRRLDHDAVGVSSLRDGITRALSEPFDVVFLDVRLPDGNGLEILPRLRESPSSPEIIIITGFGDPDGAELAIKNGAWDYIEKPSSLKETQLALTRALQYREERKLKRPPVALKLEGIVGTSRRMKESFNAIAQAAHSDANVLITGETGSGKELFAWAIHQNSSRADKSFVVVDCAALPDTLVESIIFGHEKGAFTGADKARDGLIRQAHGGTLFLDEIGELPLAVQKSFLRVLQERRFRPVGGERETASSFRLISATNKDLKQMVEGGKFREDLLFRIKTFLIELPPLRERKEDIRELLVHYMSQLCARYSIGVKGFSPEFLDALMAYDWPGNVRELIGALENAVTEALDEPTLYPKHLPTEIRVRLKKAELGGNVPAQAVQIKHLDPARPLPPLKDFREDKTSEVERSYLQSLMRATGGNMKEACRISGLSRPRLYAILKKLSMTKRD
jgi:two-component system, NtrC family, response regulator